MRYEKTVDGQTINHVWDGSKQIIADVIENQFYEADCYIRGTNLVAKYNYRNGNKSEYTYYTQNAHGDVVNLTDKDGKVTKKYTYDAFGVEKNIDENDTNAFRYCGEYYDTETGTIYLRARNYNPSTGRFISRDSFAGKLNDPLSLNLYTYCHNNPIRYIDPSGHSIISNAINNAKKAVQNSISTFKNAIRNVANNIANATKSILTNSKTSNSNVDNKNSTGAPGCSLTSCRDGCGCAAHNSTLSSEYYNLTDEQKHFISVIAGEAIGANTKEQKAVAHTIMNRYYEPRDVWSDAKSVTDVLERVHINLYKSKKIR